MKRPHDLGLLLELAQRRRDEAAQSLAYVRRQRLTAQDQMAQLQAYQRDAEIRWRQRAGTGITPTLLATHRQFIVKLEDAIRYQTQVLQELDDRVAQHEQMLIKAERDLATLQRVAQRRQNEWLRYLQRQEQKANDEAAATIHRRRTQPHP